MNFDPSYDTWEPPENLASCKDIIEHYLHKQKQQKEKEDLQKDGKKSRQKKQKVQKKKEPKVINEAVISKSSI